MRPIDADALKEKIDSMWNGRPLSSLGARILVTIDEAPSIDIEPKQGKWIDAEIRHEDGVLPIQVCSECKTFYPLEYTGGGHRFCPHCGARMKGADDERVR